MNVFNEYLELHSKQFACVHCVRRYSSRDIAPHRKCRIGIRGIGSSGYSVLSLHFEEPSNALSCSSVSGSPSSVRQTVERENSARLCSLKGRIESRRTRSISELADEAACDTALAPPLAGGSGGYPATLKLVRRIQLFLFGVHVLHMLLYEIRIPTLLLRLWTASCSSSEVSVGAFLRDILGVFRRCCHSACC